MNTFVRLETIATLVFGFCLLCAESTLTKGPNDTAVILGGTVKLECFTTDKNYPPAWSHQRVGSSEKRDISVVFKQGDGVIVTRLMQGYVERHSIVEDRDKGEYSLRITDAKPEDAGTYTCTARGGLTEKRPAELSVFETSPVCASNITDVVGENDCDKEPDIIELSCNFRVYGNHLPEVTWTDADPPKKVIKINSPTTNATGMASSKLTIKGNQVGLDKTSFQCIVGSAGNANDTRLACVTPKINVLKFSNLAESRTLVAPDEVECTGWSQLNASGCEWWFRRGEDSDPQHETLVTSKSMLNLHRPDMKAGTYICVAVFNIRGETCKVKLLNVSYKPPHATAQPGSGLSPYIAFVILGLVVVAAGIIIIFVIWYKKRRGTETPATGSDGSLQGQQGNPLLPSSQSSSDRSSHSSSDASSANSKEPTKNPVVADANGFSDKPEAISLTDRSNNPSVGIDIPDAKLGGLTKADRARLAEERAEARMRANAARRREETNQAFSPDGTDFAEGVAADKPKHE